MYMHKYMYMHIYAFTSISIPTPLSIPISTSVNLISWHLMCYKTLTCKSTESTFPLLMKLPLLHFR